MLDLARLRALHAVSVHGSVAGAATALGYTASAVSQQITKLERETRTTLLERRGRGVALTEEAVHLAATAQRLLAIVEQAETTLEERRGGPPGGCRSVRSPRLRAGCCRACWPPSRGSIRRWTPG